MEIVAKGVFRSIRACGGKGECHVSISIRKILVRGLYRS